MTKAGLDPSRIEERAALVAKVHGAKRKRAREEDGDGDVDMDDDADAGGNADGGDDAWMDVDEEETPNKRKKGNSGGVVAVNRKLPRSDRRLAGMRDEGVRLFLFHVRLRFLMRLFCSFSKRPEQLSFVTLANDRAICWRRLVRVIVSLKPKWSVGCVCMCNSTTYVQKAQTSVCRETEGRKDRQALIIYCTVFSRMLLPHLS